MAIKRRGKRPGIKGRLDALQGHGHATMNTAQGAIEAVKAAALGLMDNLQDGLDITLSKRKGVTWKDFFFGHADEMPFRLQVRFPDDPDEDETE